MSLFSIIYPVKDVAASKEIFTAVLGAEPHTDESYYVGYNVDGVEYALSPGGHQQGLTGATPFWKSDDLVADIAKLEAAGATVVQQPTDVGGGGRTASLKDPDGNMIGLMQSQA